MKSNLAAIRTLRLPYGASAGPYLVLDGVNGRVLAYNEDGELADSMAPANSVDADGNTVKRGFTSYEPGGGDSYATLDSGTVSINSFDDKIHTMLQQGLISFTENDYVGSLTEINMDGELGLNFRCRSVLRRGIWNGTDGFFYAGLLGAGLTFEKEEWNNLGITAGWAAAGAIYNTPQYKLGPDGIVHLRGTASGPAVPNGTLVLGLPAAYASPKVASFPVATIAPHVHGGITVDASGSINMYGGITSVSLEGISWSIV